MHFPAPFRRKPKEDKPPTLWQFYQQIYKSVMMFFELLISFPLYILEKLGVTAMIPTLLGTASIAGPATVVASVTTITCSIAIGVSVGLGVGLTCPNDPEMNATNATNSTAGLRAGDSSFFRF